MIAPADRLRHHLASWVGQWPPPAEGVTVVGDPARLLPTWDGSIRLLVATAARRVLDEGGVPTYLHEPSNTASARVAEAVGFTDMGWTVHGLWPHRSH